MVTKALGNEKICSETEIFGSLGWQTKSGIWDKLHQDPAETEIAERNTTVLASAPVQRVTATHAARVVAFVYQRGQRLSRSESKVDLTGSSIKNFVDLPVAVVIVAIKDFAGIGINIRVRVIAVRVIKDITCRLNHLANANEFVRIAEAVRVVVSVPCHLFDFAVTITTAVVTTAVVKTQLEIKLKHCYYEN